MIYFNSHTLWSIYWTYVPITRFVWFIIKVVDCVLDSLRGLSCSIEYTSNRFDDQSGDTLNSSLEETFDTILLGSLKRLKEDPNIIYLYICNTQ